MGSFKKRAVALLAITLPFAGAACASATEAPTGTIDDSLTIKVSPSNLMTDDELEGRQDITAEQVQTFLTKEGSYLAHYKDPSTGDSAAEIIVSHAVAHAISPLYILARVQGESSLVQSGSSRGLSTATGCGCPDGEGCSRSTAGFTAQIDCAASLMRAYLTELDETGETRADFGVGKSQRTLDPCTVVPANRATAAIYTYTPWVGQYSTGCGSKSSGGGTLLANIFQKYAADPTWATP
jgi:hypothetical protein